MLSIPDLEVWSLSSAAFIGVDDVSEITTVFFSNKTGFYFVSYRDLMNSQFFKLIVLQRNIDPDCDGVSI